MKLHAPKQRDLTLVELLVATVLGTILVGVATFVWMQSNDIFTTTVNRLETYQRMRTVLDVMERDLANTNRTVDMEFFNDTEDPPNGHFDRGVDTPFQHPPGADFRTPRDPNDPLNGQPEFGVDPAILLDGGNQRYFYAPVIFSPEPYEITEDGYTQARAYWRDEIYVRSFASVQGVNRPALVHYRLVQPVAGGRSLLRRRIWFLDTDGTLKDPNVTTGDPGTDQVAILSHGIADLKVGFYFKASASQTGSVGQGRWYHVGEIGSTYSGNAKTLIDSDVARGFTATNDPTNALSRQHLAAGQFNNIPACTFVYDGNARLELPEIGPVTMRTLDRSATDLSTLKLQNAADLAHYSNFDFPGVRPGAKVYISDATDDDDQYVNNQAAGSFFESRVLTVDSIVADSRYQTFVGVIFKEPVNFQRLFSTWLGKESVFTVTNAQTDPNSGTYPTAGPERKIAASFNVKYRVGFLPAAFMIRLSCDDRNNQKILPMERVIRLLQQ